MHIGSGILEPGPLMDAARRLGELARDLTREGAELAYVDVGGGLGVPYRPDDEPLDVHELGEGIRARLPDGPELVVEPGRYLVAESTVLLVRVTSVKGSFVGVDAGLQTLLRPALYDAYHHVSNLSRPGADLRRMTVVGPICETGDVLARDREIPHPVPGDLLAVHDTGAYGYSMASRYNSRPLPAEVLVDGGAAELIREREELADLFDRVPG
jgi:diaminopimelate decarboxylase